MDQSEFPKYAVPVIKLGQPDDNYKFQPLPKPTGSYPFHLDVGAIIPGDDKKLIFHITGDTGDLLINNSQLKVIDAMIEQCNETGSKPQFLYHLGDIVYNHGEASRYPQQFFQAYAHYPAPIVAIPGNHDADVNPLVEPYNSLDAFKAVFCDTHPQTISFSNGAIRKSIVQPNVYWTLKSPLANIIGLYSNVPKYGVITDEQKQWFVEELKAAKQETGKALIVCLHHSPYSSDINHGSSLPMISILEDVFTDTSIRPDAVFSGHVHNYQRFSKQNADGTTTPYIVAGSGGYDQLHAIVAVSDEGFTTDSPLLKNVNLENYCDTHHGFLKITIEKRHNGMFLKGEFFLIDEDADTNSTAEPKLFDFFEVRINRYV